MRLTAPPRPVALLLLLALLFVIRSAAADDPSAPSSAPWRNRASIGSELAMSIGATSLLAPAIYSSARLVGTSTGNLNTSALPALLLAAILPPVVATGAVVYERRREGAHARFLPAFWYALGAQLLVLAGGVVAKTWVERPSELLLFSGVTGAVVGGAATLGAEVSF